MEWKPGLTNIFSVSQTPMDSTRGLSNFARERGAMHREREYYVQEGMSIGGCG